jgi:hypothetical protein
MANTETTPSRKQGGSSWISVAVALAATAVFIGWLATREPPEAVAVEEPDAAPAAGATDPAGPPQAIEAGALAGAGAQQYLGQYVQLTGVEVMSPLGARLMWIDAGGNPYLVHLPEGTTQPASTGRLRITGTVQAKDDGVLDEWEQTGVLESSDHRLQAEFGTTYLQARRVEPVAG